MTPTSDKTLHAYLDCELNARAAAALERRLRTDADLQARLERMQRADEAARRAFPVSSATPEGMTASIRAHRDDLHRARGAARLQSLPQFRVGVITAFAASVTALAIGLAAGRSSLEHTERTSFAHVSNGALTTALNTLESGQNRADDNQSIGIVLSFFAGDGRACRQFTSDTLAAHAEGVACKSHDGWTIAAYETAPASPDGYRPAGVGMIDAAIDALGAGETLTPAQERDLMAMHWRSAAH